MSKVKIVQIAIGGSSDEYDELFLDDKGRVWRDYGKNIKAGTNEHGDDYYEWRSDWKQVDLPEEPES